jgi:cytochrome P450
MIILNSAKRISDLLDKRSKIYSDKVRALFSSPSQQAMNPVLESLAPISDGRAVSPFISGSDVGRSHMLTVRSLGIGWAFSVMRYGRKWKSYRRLFHEYMGPGPVKEYEEAICKAVDSLLVRLEKDPEHFRGHTKL